MNLIDREMLMFSLMFCDEIGDMPCEQMKKVFKVIKAQPLKNTERARGWWIPVTNGRGGCECSLCHSYAPSYQSGGEWLSNYCPCCGEKMNMGEDDDT